MCWLKNSDGVCVCVCMCVSGGKSREIPSECVIRRPHATRWVHLFGLAEAMSTVDGLFVLRRIPRRIKPAASPKRTRVKEKKVFDDYAEQLLKLALEKAKNQM